MMRIKQATSLVLALTLALAAPAYPKDGKKYFKEGLRYEANKQWDKAAEKFALAAAEDPSNPEYSLHLQRALVNAAIMLVERGDYLAEQKDYNSAYQAYRQAYSFDPTNELALIKMRRMLELQGLPTDSLPSGGDPAGPSLKPREEKSVKTSGGSAELPLYRRIVKASMPARMPKTDVIFRNTSLQSAIEQLAQAMRLNVVFDSQTLNFLRSVGNNFSIELRNVTYAKALETILQANNLMYAQTDTRTIVIAQDNPQSRSRYEQFAVKAFYIKHADLNDVRTALQQVLGTKVIVPSKQLNMLVVRDTPANIEMAESVINSMDKAKAEVLIDINIYEISRDDLMKIGNQLLAESEKSPSLKALGGLNQQSSILGKAPRTLTGPFAFGLALPSSVISLFQDRNKAKLLASTQVHVLDGEQHIVRIGQRVPIRTATIPTGFVTPTPQQPNQPQQPGLSTSLFGVEQIQYENVGLNIDMKPQVYEDEVQITMKIESSSVDSLNTLTPTFSQKQMQSVARIKDGQTTMIAGVSQLQESKGTRGIPLIGLIPILGRFFSAPDTTNRQSDIVITVTPHILRRADIRDEDHLAKLSGWGEMNQRRQVSLEEIVYFADLEEAEQNQVAAKPAAPIQQVGPASPQPQTFAPSSPGVTVVPSSITQPAAQPSPQPRPTAAPQPAASEPRRNVDDEEDEDEEDSSEAQNQSSVRVSVNSSPVAFRGQQFYAVVILSGNQDISSANISLSYDPNMLEVRNVREGGLMRLGGATPNLQYTAQGGILNATIELPPGAAPVKSRGTLIYIMFEVKAPGRTTLSLTEGTTLRGPSGNSIPVTLQPTSVEIR